jgi:hypothetical protein
MSTSGIQNYLSNVFRPIYIYDQTNSNFTPKLELSNIDTYSGNTVSVFTAAVGDSNSNVYVGSNAGNPYNVLQACSNVTAVGFGAGSNISNVSNSVYLGFYAGAGATNANNVIAIGERAGGNGTSNIFIGTSNGRTIGAGSSNIFIGHGIDISSVSSQVRIGNATQIPIAADLSTNWVGLGGITTATDTTYSKVEISGSTWVQGNLGVNTQPGNRTLDVNGNFRSQDGFGTLDFSNGVTRSTGGFTSVQSNIAAGVGLTPIGTIKKGIIHVSAVNQASSTNRAAYIFFAWTPSNVTTMTATSNGNTNIVTNSTNIQIDSSSALTFDYSITYFPLP